MSFPELVRAGILQPGAEIKCKALMRQIRKGAEPYIEAGKVLADGCVEYRGQNFVVPSKLAVAVVNANGGEAKALNGYDYLFVRLTDGIVKLKELRDRFLKQHS